MFEQRSLQQLFSEFSFRKSPVKNADKIGLNDPFYLDYILNYEGLEIIPDIRLLGYEEVLRENNYLVANYPQLADQVWMIGNSYRPPSCSGNWKLSCMKRRWSISSTFMELYPYHYF